MARLLLLLCAVVLQLMSVGQAFHFARYSGLYSSQTVQKVPSVSDVKLTRHTFLVSVHPQSLPPKRLSRGRLSLGMVSSQEPSPSVVSSNSSSSSEGDNSDNSDVGDFSSSWMKCPLRQYLHWDVVGTLFGKLLSTVISDEDILDISTKCLSGVLWFSVIVGALGTAGFDTKPILSIFGVAGITLGLSLQNLFSDLYAGLFVLFTRPFKRGNCISVGGFTGKVESIDMRYVHLSNGTETVVLPVSLVYRNAVRIIGPRDRKKGK